MGFCVVANGASLPVGGICILTFGLFSTDCTCEMQPAKMADSTEANVMRKMGNNTGKDILGLTCGDG